MHLLDDSLKSQKRRQSFAREGLYDSLNDVLRAFTYATWSVLNSVEDKESSLRRNESAKCSGGLARIALFSSCLYQLPVKTDGDIERTKTLLLQGTHIIFYKFLCGAKSPRLLSARWFSARHSHDKEFGEPHFYFNSTSSVVPSSVSVGSTMDELA